MAKSREKRNAIRVAPLAIAASDKYDLFGSLKEAGKGGIVFKRLSARYSPGRPASGGDQFKFKFVESCTCVVLARNAKRSVELGLIDDQGTQVSVGNCTIPPNKNVPGLGSLVEIRYLYAYKGGALYQPFYLGAREDLDGADLVRDLKFKAEATN